MPEYSANDLKAIESLMVFDAARDETIQPPVNGRQPERRSTISYARGDKDQFADLMNFEASFVSGLDRAASERLSAEEKPAGDQWFYTKSDLSMFERIFIPEFTNFTSRSGGNASAKERGPFYTPEDLAVFSELTQAQSGESEEPMPDRRENSGPAAMKIIDVDKERAAERKKYWGNQGEIKIVFSDAKHPRASR